MAEETKDAGEQVADKKGGLLRTLLIPIVVGVVCAAVGFTVPLAFPSLVGIDKEAAEPEVTEPTFVPFGDVVVNLNEGRMNRYLRLGITLQIITPPEEIAALQTQIESKKAILTSWLLGYLADMSMEDIRGAAGQNRLRREIHDQFNLVLFPDGDGEIADVLFEEFNVQ